MSHAITLLDGAVGTNLWAMAAERGIPRVPVWQYNVTHPELVSELAARYPDVPPSHRAHDARCCTLGLFDR